MASPQKFTCINCRIKFDSAELQRAHFKTEWHIYNLKRRVCNLNPIDLESFDAIPKFMPPLIDDDEETQQSISEIVGELPKNVKAHARMEMLKMEEENDDGWETDSEFEDLEEYETDGEENERIDPLEECWELHLPHRGISIGHRSLLRYYKQRLCPTRKFTAPRAIELPRVDRKTRKLVATAQRTQNYNQAKIEFQNNMAMRGRIRPQNPI